MNTYSIKNETTTIKWKALVISFMFIFGIHGASAQALNGAYTVNPALASSSSNFTSIAAMTDSLNSNGISGPTTIYISNGLYAETMHLINISGLSASNTLTIDGGNAARTIVTGSGAAAPFATLILEDVKYVTIQNISFKRVRQTTGSVILLKGSSHNTISYCESIFTPNPPTGSGTRNIAISGSITAFNVTNIIGNYNKFNDNRIIGAAYGIYFNGAATTSHNGTLIHNKFYNNIIDSVSYSGMQIQYTDSLEIIGNKIYAINGSVATAATNGMVLNNTINFKINQNYIWAKSSGIQVSSLTNNNFNPTRTIRNEIINNMVYTSVEGNASAFALNVQYADSTDIWHNSINSESPSTAAVRFMENAANPLTGLDIRNNIFSSRYNGVFTSNLGYDTTMFDKLDYNLYFCSECDDLFEYNTNGANNNQNLVITSLEDYQILRPMYNIASIEKDPTFNTPTDLHIMGMTPYEKGDNSIGVNIDIDGDPRPGTNSTTVDIGADEYIPPTCPFVMDIGTTDPSRTEVSIFWTSVSGRQNSDFEYVIVPCGINMAAGTPITTTLDSLRVTGLTPHTCYDLYVRELCGRGDNSIWRGPIDFYTTSIVPYSEDFETFKPLNYQNPWKFNWTVRYYPASKSLNPPVPRWTTDTSSGVRTGTRQYTGPLYDHTNFGSIGGRYMAIDLGGTSLSEDVARASTSKGDSADFISGAIYIDSSMSTVELSYWYFMYGGLIDKMKVLIDTNGVEEVVAVYYGEQQQRQSDEWLQEFIYLEGYQGKEIKVIFRGYPSAGTTAEAEVAVDDIVIKEAPKYDAGLISLINPSESSAFCSGNFSPVVTIKNFGADTLKSINIVWDLNGTKDSITHTTLMSTGDEAQVTLGSISINPNQSNELIFYTSLPNGIKDAVNHNDTLIFKDIRPGLSGIYTLDPSQAASASNYTNFDDLTAYLNEHGVCGPVTINVAPGTYNESVYFGEIRGASPINNITIDGGDSSQTIITHDATSRYATLTFDYGANHIHVKNMSIITTAASAGAAVIFAEKVQYDTLSNCYIKAPSLNQTTLNAIVFSSNAQATANNARASHIVIKNNRIIGGRSAIVAQGANGKIGVHNQVLGNTIDSAYAQGIQFTYQDSLEVIGNSINLLGAGTAAAPSIVLTSISNTIISSNFLWARQYGINITNNTPTGAPITRSHEISNNMVYSNSNVAIRLYYLDSVNLYHNTVHTEATGVNSHSVHIFDNASFPISASSYDVRNNIFTSLNTTALFVTAPDSIYSHFDNNIIYSAGSNLMTLGGNAYTTISDYTAASAASFNQNSIQAYPGYISNTDLHIADTVAVASQKGDNTVGIWVDIDGEERPSPGSSIVDIGADEYLLDRDCKVSIINNGVSNITYYSADIYWTDTASINNYQYVIVPCQDNISAGTIVTTNLDNVRLDSLSANTCYKYYVRSICNATDTSNWSNATTFSTEDYPYYPIGIINTSDANGIADSIDVYNWTSGTVVGENLTSTGYNFTLIDMSTNSQEGIRIYSDTAIDSYTVNEGDSLMVRGKVKQNLGLTEFHIDSIVIISSGNAIPTPINVSSLDESTESKLIEIKKFVLLDSSQVGTYSMRAYNGTDTLSILINEHTSISDSLAIIDNALNIGDTLCVLVGIGTQADYSSTSPYLDGYYVIPMSYSDIEVCNTITGIKTNVYQTSDLTFYPNPTNGNFTIIGTGLESKQAVLTIHDMSGKLIMEERINSSNEFKKDYNLEGYAKGLYFISITDGQSRITKKLILK